MKIGNTAGRGRLAAVFAAGVLSSLGFAPWNLWLLTFAALALLIHQASRAPSVRSALALGWWFGLGHFLLGTHWIAQAFRYQQELPGWTGWLGVVLLSLYLAVYPAMAAGAARFIAGAGTPFVITFAATWTIAEWLRGWLLTGFPWNPLGAVTLPVPGVGAAAAVVGAGGLSLLVCLTAGGLLLLYRRDTRRSGTALCGIFVLAMIAGSVTVRAPSPLTATRLDIVQANIGQDEKWSKGGVERAIDKYLALTPPPRPEPRLLIWPEAAVPDLLDEMPDVRVRIGAALGPDDLVLLGALKAIRGAQGLPIAARNSLFVLDPAGRIMARYDKKHLVPFGEYLPLRVVLEALGLARLAPGELDFWPGPGARTLALPGHPAVGPLICYEIIFGGETVDPGYRPRWLLNISNDAWFAGAGAEMHLAQARLRAIEEGLPVARATPTGISAVIDPRGRVLAAMARDKAGVILARLPAPLPPTFYSRIGNAVPLGLAVSLLGITLAWKLRRR